MGGKWAQRVMSSPYELMAGLALLREKKRLASYSNDKSLESWPALLVRMGDTTCVLRQGDVDEIIARGRLSRINGVANWVIGLGYFRGQLLTVLDGAKLLGFCSAQQSIDATARIMVVSGDEEWLGIQVDELLGIRHIWSDNMGVAPPVGALEMVWSGYIECWIKLEENTVPVLQVKSLVRALEQHGEIGVKTQS